MYLDKKCLCSLCTIFILLSFIPILIIKYVDIEQGVQALLLYLVVFGGLLSALICMYNEPEIPIRMPRSSPVTVLAVGVDDNTYMKV